MEQKSKIRLWSVVAAAVIVAAAVWFWRGYSPAGAPGTSETAGPALSADDTTATLEAEANATDLGNLEAELQSTETDLQSL